MPAHAAPRAQRRLLRRRHRPAQPAGRPEAQPVAAAARRRHDVRQRRQQRRAPRRARRPAAGRRAQVRAGAGAQRIRGAARPAVEVADPRARPPGGPHRRQPAAVDDGAVQRRLPRRGRRPAPAARLQRPRVAGEHGARDALRRLSRRDVGARRAGGGRRAARRQGHRARLAGAERADPSGRCRKPSPASTRSSSGRAASTPA